MGTLSLRTRRSSAAPAPRKAARIGCLLLVALPACSAQEPQARGDTGLDDATAESLAGAELVLLFDGVAVPGDTVPAVRNDGDARVRLEVVTANGGNLTWAEGRGAGMALRTPPFAPDGLVPAAAVLATPAGGGDDVLSPGRRTFRLEVDLEADPPEAGRDGDDGDNLVQRGRYGEGVAQYKLQLDHGIPACRVAGTEGQAELAADDPLRPGRWYRLTCTRTADEVRLVVLDLEAGSLKVVDESVAVDVGDVALEGVPLSVAAKVGDDGRLDPAGLDQFHGVIDRVVVDVS